MSEDYPTLRRHRLAYIPTLKVDPLVFTTRFSGGCQTANCSAACCKSGVYADVAERDRILENAQRVQSMMDDRQDRDPDHWFEAEELTDPDFPSGRVAGTQVINNRCVFLDGANRCTLQRVSASMNGDLQLKPFFCRLYPLTLQYGVLTLDTEHVEGRTECCGGNATGHATIFDVCREEIDLVVDPDGADELRRLADNIQDDSS